MNIETDEDRNILFFAFRYSLGRRTYAVDIVCDGLKRNWLELREYDRQQIKKEIQEAIDDRNAGDNCDIENWKEILAL